MCNYHYLEHIITKWSAKNLVIDIFDVCLTFEVCLKYSQILENPQMIFSEDVCSRDIFETLPWKDPIKLCVAKLRRECEEFYFPLDSRY